MAHIVIETTFDPPVTQELWDELNAKAEPCLNERGVRWLRSLVSRDRRRSICEFEAADAETVREAYRKSGISFDRLWVADILGPES